MLQKIKETVEFLENRISTRPEVGIILGTGLGGLVNVMDIEQSISYEDIPNFPCFDCRGSPGATYFWYVEREENHGNAGKVSLL